MSVYIYSKEKCFTVHGMTACLKLASNYTAWSNISKDSVEKIIPLLLFLGLTLLWENACVNRRHSSVETYYDHSYKWQY